MIIIIIIIPCELIIMTTRLLCRIPWPNKQFGVAIIYAGVHGDRDGLYLCYV